MPKRGRDYIPSEKPTKVTKADEPEHSINYNELIVKACKENDPELVKECIANGCDNINKTDNVIHCLNNESWDALFEMLNCEKVNPSVLQNFALSLAAENGRKDVVELILKHRKFNPLNGASDAAYHAWSNKHYDILKMFMDDKRLRTGEWCRDLVLAASVGDTRAIELLATRVIIDRPYYDAISAAVKSEHWDTIVFLFKYVNKECAWEWLQTEAQRQGLENGAQKIRDKCMATDSFVRKVK